MNSYMNGIRSNYPGSYLCLKTLVRVFQRTSDQVWHEWIAVKNGSVTRCKSCVKTVIVKIRNTEPESDLAPQDAVLCFDQYFSGQGNWVFAVCSVYHASFICFQ